MTKPTEAKAGIAEWLTIHYQKLPPDLKNDVAAKAVAILESEGFFEIEAGGEG